MNLNRNFETAEAHIMHVHPNQVNPNLQMDAMYAAQRGAAKREAERTRRKLAELASELTGEADAEACVVKLEARGEPEAETPQNRPQRTRRQNQDRKPATEASSISDWA